MTSINTSLRYSTYSREPRPELDERRAQPPRLELGHALHQLLEVRLRDVLEVVEVAGDVEDRVFEFRGPVVLDPFEQTLLVAINHYGYVAGLLAAPPERAIRVATGFLVLGGAVIVYAGQLWLDTAPAFWSCTALTTAMIGAHVIVL